MSELQSATPVETATPPAESTSLAEHEAQYGEQRDKDRIGPREPDVVEAAVEQKPAEPAADGKKERHRAKSQQAGPDDVPRIRELTRKLHEANASWEAKYKALEARLNEAAPPKTAATTTEPKLEDFQHEADPYGEWLIARTEFRAEQRRQKDAAESQKTTAEDQRMAAYNEQQKVFGGKLAKFAETHPDFWDVLQSENGTNTPVPDLLGHVIATDDNPGELMYALGLNPDLLQQARRESLVLHRNGEPLVEADVAYLRRYVQEKIASGAAGTTGAAPSTPQWTPAAPPPTPVRTSPVTTGDPLPGDGASLLEHERAFGPGSRYDKRRRP